MKKFLAVLFIAVFMIVGLVCISEARVYKYKFHFTLVADTNGQTPDAAYYWNEGTSVWVQAPVATIAVNLEDATSHTVQYDSATNTSSTSNFDLNFITSIDGTTFDNTAWYSIDDIGDAVIKTVGISYWGSYVKYTIDEDSAATGSIDIKVEVTKPY